jgi:hypothetical protein
VLLRSGNLTNPEERTIQIQLSGLQIPADGISICVELETQLGDPDAGGGAFNRIKVWEMEQDYQQPGIQQDLVFEYTFEQMFSLEGTQLTPTPTGYYRVRLTITPQMPSEVDPSTDHGETVVELDEIFLLENQWVVPLVSENQRPVLGPRELVVFYTDMTPYQTNTYQRGNRMRRESINRYIGDVIVPGMLEVIRLETETWGLGWDRAWRGHRDVNWPNSLTVALTDDGIWYHGKAPKGGYETISINVHQLDLKTYSDLTDWILSIFSHELFHNLQRSQNMQAGGHGDIAGRAGTWELVTEGTALLVETYVREQYQFSDGRQGNPYSLRAYRFQNLGMLEVEELEAYLLTVSPYDVAVYWRFIAAQCSGPESVESVKFIRRVLAYLYSNPDLLSASPEQLPAAYPELMDRVFLDQSQCPFNNFTESLASFSRFLALREMDTK